MSTLRLALAATIAAAVLSACDHGKSPSSSYGGFSGPPDTGSPSQPRYVRSTRASRLADEFTISCRNGICPAGTGVLFLSTVFDAGTCTAWLAGEIEGKSVLMTNKHCVEHSHDCSEDLAFKLPVTGEAAQCERLIGVSPYALDSGGKIAIVPDYAIILLDRKLGAPPLKLSQAGLDFESKVTLRKAWKTGSRSIEMREEICATGTTSLLVSDYKDATSPNVTLYGCDVIGGVSGSPILNAAGEVAALVQIGPKGEGMSLPSIPGLDAHEFDIGTLAIGTNLACIDNSAVGLSHPAPGCELPKAGESSAIPKFSDMLKPRTFVKATIEELAAFMRKEDSGLFGWTVRPDDGGRVVGAAGALLKLEMIPKCVLRPDDKESKLKQNYYDSGYYGYFAGYKKEGSIMPVTPAWGIGLKIDKYGGVAVNFMPASKLARYSFNPQEIAALQPDGAVRVVEDSAGVVTELMLPLCPAGYRSRDLKENAEAEDAVRRGDDKALERLLERQAEREKSEG